MVSRTILLGFFVCLLMAFGGCTKSSNMVTDGVEAKALKIERASSIPMGMGAFTARQGQDIAHFVVEVKASNNVKELKLKTDEQQLIDTDGKSYKSNADLTFTFGSGGGTMSMSSMFEVPKGATLKTLKLGRASLDVSGMDGAKPGTGALSR
jgi:hypothetical protein